MGNSLDQYLKLQGDYFLCGGTGGTAGDGPNDAQISQFLFVYKVKTATSIHALGGHNSPLRACDIHPCGIDDNGEWELLTAADDCVRLAVVSDGHAGSLHDTRV